MEIISIEGIILANNPRWESNQDINNIHGLIDLITDQYGNYYTPYTVTTKAGKLIKVTLCHELYDIAFSWMFRQEEWMKDYQYSHLGEP